VATYPIDRYAARRAVEMTRMMTAMGALVALAAMAGGEHRRHDAFGIVRLNGESTKVHWTDGDSFNVRDGSYRGKGTRLVGYNTLEAYGPVHSWGEWTPEELFEFAADAARVAAAEEWSCSTDGKQDGYHRLLVSCPALAVEMARLGYGLAYAVDGAAAAPEVLEAQAQAQAAGRGIWRRGVVRGIVTSVHSESESPGAEAYNRVVDTKTGQAVKRAHRQSYRTCELVCEETQGARSCMVYVPFERRYRQKAACLR
jgi:micrococcal nuclease